jgi:hypothetical protein
VYARFMINWVSLTQEDEFPVCSGCYPCDKLYHFNFSCISSIPS